MFACFPYMFGWLAASLATSVNYLYISRLLVGISHALLTTTVYTVEISSREMRGTYSLLESVLRCFGCLLIYCLGFVLRWHVIAIFAPVIPIAAFASAVFLAPESPVYLLAKHRLVQIIIKV
jgi:MFS family permease